MSDISTVKHPNVWGKVKEEEIMNFCEDYKTFLNENKTERECAKEIIQRAESNGFKNIDESSGGFKFYRLFKNKVVGLCIVGKDFNVKEGYNYIVSHIDSPRLDLKPNCLFEDGQFALFKTHYYGGIRKYQWMSIPLSMHGSVYTKDGKEVEFRVGEKDDEPVFTIPDLLPHLAFNHRNKTLSQSHEGEKLNILCGSIPLDLKKNNQLIKKHVLKILQEKYGVCEEDLLWGEIEFVPSFKARDVGFDRGLICSYGQDDRVCSYCSMKAIFDIKEQPQKTIISLFYDKEEIGSEGGTGAKTLFLEDFTADILKNQIKEKADSFILRKVLLNSDCLSADVNAGFNPIFKEVHDSRNVALCGKGVVMTKYTGARGKSSSNDARAEFFNKIRRIFKSHGVISQHGLLGKIDLGGGGTLAKHIAANSGMDVVDIGVALLGMHSPNEISSKADVFMCYYALKSFILGMNKEPEKLPDFFLDDEKSD